MVTVNWLWLQKERHNSFWDWSFLQDLFEGKHWKPPGFPEFTHHHGAEVQGEGGIVVIAARNQKDDIKRINAELAKLKWCLVILTGDEQAVFPWRDLKHANMKVWAMSPHPERHREIRGLVNGCPPQAEALGKLRGPYDEKPLDWFFAGQMGHAKREQCAEALERVPNGKLVRTGGFTQGLEHEQYYRLLAQAKFAPCPSGPHTPDTFRLYEALEAGCIPIVDSHSSDPDYPGGFWDNLFGPVPFLIVDDWASVQDVINDFKGNWRQRANECFAWWQAQKRQYAYGLMTDLYHLAGVELDDGVTVMMPSSTIRAHPSTEMINETISSVRDRLPDAEILITVDGLRLEQDRRKTNYDEYKRRLLWETNWQHQNILPVLFHVHSHQSLMAKATIDEVKTSYLLYVEHDTPLVDEIDFDDVVNNLDKFNLIRFSHEAVIPKPHRDMMLDKEPVGGYIRTVQWSGRPHLARTEFYRWLISELHPDKKAFIEHVFYGKIVEEFLIKGFEGWLKYKLALYAPDPDNLRRSANLDGRGTDPVFESEV